MFIKSSGDGKFVLFQVNKFVVICYRGHKNLLQEGNVKLWIEVSENKDFSYPSKFTGPPEFSCQVRAPATSTVLICTGESGSQLSQVPSNGKGERRRAAHPRFEGPAPSEVAVTWPHPVWRMQKRSSYIWGPIPAFISSSEQGRMRGLG